MTEIEKKLQEIIDNQKVLNNNQLIILRNQKIITDNQQLILKNQAIIAGEQQKTINNQFVTYAAINNLNRIK